MIYFSSARLMQRYPEKKVFPVLLTVCERMKMKWIVPLVGSLFLATSLVQSADPPVELGAVTWGRDLEDAKQQSANSGKPVFVLFQEVPG